MTKIKKAPTVALLATFLASQGLVPSPANAAIGDDYQCQTETVVNLTARGIQELDNRGYDFHWGQNTINIRNFPLISDFSDSLSISYQDGNFVSSRSLWADINFKADSGVMVIYVGRENEGNLFWARCSKRQ